MHNRLAIIISLILLNSTILFAEVIESPKNIVAAYYENKSYYRPATGNRPPFTPQLIDPSILTDIYYAFACFGYVTKSLDPSNPHTTGDFTLQPTDKNDQTLLYPQIVALKQRNKNLKLFLSIGGWSFNDPNDPEGLGQHTYKLFSQMISSQANRKQFIDSAIAYVHKFGFDGLDIDWEYPGDITRGGSEQDFDNFILFLKECSLAFQNNTPQLILSYTAPATIPAGVPKRFHDNSNDYFQWLARCTQYVDRINMMCYDYHGPFNIPKITGVNAPLTRDTSAQSQLYVAKTLQNCLNNNIPANKIILGMPAFGHTFGGVSGLTQSDNGPGKPFTGPGELGPSTRSSGLLAYFEIADLIAQLQLSFATDNITDTAYGYHIVAGKWVSFDTPNTIKLKSELAKKLLLKGVMFWSVDLDEYYWKPTFPNIRSAWKTFNLENQ